MSITPKQYVFRGKYQTISYDSFGAVINDLTSSYSGPTRDWGEVKAGNERRNWRELVRRHVQATNAYTGVKYSIRVTPGSISTYSDLGSGIKQRVIVRGDIVTPSSMAFFAPITVADLKLKVYLKWLKKANAEIQTSRGLVSLGELRETIHQIRHPCESLKKGIMDYLKAVPRNARYQIGRAGARSMRKREKAVAEAISGTYLEHANGWAPFVSDIEATSRTLAEHFAESGISYTRVQAAQKEEDVISSRQITAQQSTGHPAAQWRRYQHGLRTSAVEIVGEVVVSHSGKPDELIKASGFTWGQFVPTIYELVPMSYIADWFWNMGDLLEGFAFCSSDRAWWSRSSLNKVHGTITGSCVPPSGGDLTRSGNPGSCEVKSSSLERDDPGNTSLKLEFSLPGSHLFSKLANVGSIGVQAFTSSQLLNRLIHG